ALARRGDGGGKGFHEAGSRLRRAGGGRPPFLFLPTRGVRPPPARRLGFFLVYPRPRPLPLGAIPERGPAPPPHPRPAPPPAAETPDKSGAGESPPGSGPQRNLPPSYTAGARRCCW